MSPEEREDPVQEETYYAGHLGIPVGWSHDDDDDEAPYDPAIGGGFI